MQDNIEEQLSENIHKPAKNEIFGLIKPYRGNCGEWRIHRKAPSFYDEREWRFVPIEFPFGISKRKYLDERNRRNTTII